MPFLDTPIERRRILKGFLIAGPTLAIAARLGLDGSRETAGANIASPDMFDRQDFTDIFLQTAEPFYYDLRVEIKPDNRVYFEIPRMDIGQGVMTSVTMMMADNLDVPFENFDTALSNAEPKRASGQLTGGSHSVRSLWDPVRVVAATMRGNLKMAASQRWGVPPGTLRTENGYVVAPDGRELSYGELTAEAARIAPKDVPKGVASIKKPEEYKIIGKVPTSRMNARDIATGKALYAMDIPIEGAKPTVLALNATHGATVESVDDSEAKKIPGVIAITQFPGMPEMFILGGVAITAETFGIARKAKNALKIKWSAGTMDNLSDGSIDELLKGIQDKVVAPDGDQTIDAVFRWPYVGHAPMETNTAIANVTADKIEVWSGLQIPNTFVRNIAKVLGYKEEQVVAHIMPHGGAFGRSLFHDAAFQAAQISKLAGMPIKLMWLREEDIKHGRTRPASVHHVKATVRNGTVTSFEHRMACPEMDLRHGLGDIISHQVVTYNNNGADQYFYNQSGSGHIPYDVGFFSSTLQQHLLAVPTSPWRVVYSGQVCPLNEIVMDELARMLGRDEYEFRREHLKSDKFRAVLDKAAHEGQWGRKLPAGVAQGLGFHDEYHSQAAYLMEVDTRGREPRMTRCTIAVDPGFLVNEKGLKATLLSAAHDGFATVFKGSLHIDNGATRESNWHDYKWTRMADSATEMSVHIIPNTQAQPGGAGELGIPAAAAAAANAWARATGKAPRNFPINEQGA